LPGFREKQCFCCILRMTGVGYVALCIVDRAKWFRVQMNFGAALRSAFFLGAAGVLSCARNSSPLSPVVSKASAGVFVCCIHTDRYLA